MNKTVFASTNLVVGSQVYIRTSESNAEKRGLSTIIEITPESMWLSHPHGEILSFSNDGALMTLSIEDDQYALVSEVRVLHIRRDLLCRDFEVTLPSDWQFLHRRASPRVAMELEVLLLRVAEAEAKIKHYIPGHLVDIGISGARIVSRIPFIRGDLLFLQLQCPGSSAKFNTVIEVIRLIAKRKHVGSSCEFSARFLSLTSDRKNFLEDYISSATQ